MKKIAVASEQELVTGHFGHCANFNIYEMEDGKIIKRESVPNPGHKRGFLPKFLNDLGVDVVITSGIGKGAVDLFQEMNMEVFMGVTGKAEDAVIKYLQGQLFSDETVCHGHHHGENHHHNC